MTNEVSDTELKIQTYTTRDMFRKETSRHLADVFSESTEKRSFDEDGVKFMIKWGSIVRGLCSVMCARQKGVGEVGGEREW